MGEYLNSIHIHGGMPLHGEVKIQGSKNEVLPILAATILVKGTCVIQNCPNISDVMCMIKLLRSIGCSVFYDHHEVIVDAIDIIENRLPKEYVTSMRSSVMLMGALIQRTGEVVLDYPGGCVIGDRPIDIHIAALTQLGVTIEYKSDGLKAYAEKLHGNEIVFPFPSVGATENAILAAVLTEGTTKIINAAKEPEIVGLCKFLVQAGAKITGYGTDSITISGVKELHPIVYRVESDRIVAGTYLFATMASGGETLLRNAPSGIMSNVIDMARIIGADIKMLNHDMLVKRKKPLHGSYTITTEVYPGFPSDLQSMLLAVLTQVEGNSTVTEKIFNNRFNAARELQRMGAWIEIEENKAHIRGKCKLQGRLVIAEDLRGGAALVLAGLCAEGDTFVANEHFIQRGYEDICRDLNLLGANIRRRCEETQIKEKK